MSHSVFTSEKKWKQTWVDNSGGYLDFEGKAEKGRMTFFRTARRNGKEIRQRMVFYDIYKDRFTWDWESSADEGETWKLAWRINYKRAKSPSLPGE